MKHNLLDEYKAFLLERYAARAATAHNYTVRMGELLKDFNANELEGFDISKAISVLETVKYKSYFSQYKNALLKFCEFKNIQLSKEQIDTIEVLQEKTKKKYRKNITIDYNVIKNKIDRLKNTKLKLGYVVMLATGLRVSEVEQIKPSDCKTLEDSISFHFIGKGNKPSVSTLHRISYPKIYDMTKSHIEGMEKAQSLFYSAVYLQRRAKEMGFHCHDLRRIYAKEEYKRTKSKEAVQERLHHSNPKTTRIYLRSRIKF